MVSYRGAPHFHPIKSEKSGKVNEGRGRGDKKSLPFPGMAGRHVFPVLTNASRGCTTEVSATRSEAAVPMVILTSNPNRKLLISR